ncbi:hypothetical protein STRMOE7_21125 [Streptomyces sp. MOE7]|nr:hypothetical protein STRMOE7_21125 [Streptomyces sp. MOE7]
MITMVFQKSHDPVSTASFSIPSKPCGVSPVAVVTFSTRPGTPRIVSTAQPIHRGARTSQCGARRPHGLTVASTHTTPTTDMRTMRAS